LFLITSTANHPIIVELCDMGHNGLDSVRIPLFQAGALSNEKRVKYQVLAY